ncbi:hypothetical protein APR41_17635 [Salegentibacter salinarum]|uniref:Type IV secretion protein Rhs n=1 Tax=Salegentibacter salinarum TaxID=447422 RepID=A0A2N0TVE3_9FLAO|nr:RHS repeat-associated core domain-containing protein [Salegentibacter salinarum]PKD18732.1 hypothetical protein APR41_17635 [Salegentibacter salinarum]SKB98685.1 RHS repeat-associated core domain-containing protein [Salegentibacter salinarum]
MRIFKNVLFSLIIILLGEKCLAQQTPELRNSLETITYRLDGDITSRSKEYYNELGKKTQMQSVDILSNKTWAMQVLYDAFGRPALQSLSAPIGNSGFLYNEDFIKKPGGGAYSASDFDTDQENPAAVGTQQNSLGWYYSGNNSNEPNQDVTSFPFSRTIYSTLNPGQALKSIGGNKINGEWKNGYSFSMKASQELSQSAAFGETKYNSIKTTKTVVKDVHGVENVVFADTDGNTLAAARSGGGSARNMSLSIGEQGYVDIHVPNGGNANGLTINSSGGVETEVFNLITENPVSGSTEGLGNGFYRVSITNLESYDPDVNPVTVNYKENYYDYSLNLYNKAGMLIATRQPLNQLETTFKYDAMGQLNKTTSPDEGTAEFKYRKDGQIRYSQNGKQEVEGEFSYTNYDEKGRPVESGVLQNNDFPNANPDTALPSGSRSEQNFTLYDVPDNTGLHTALTNSSIPVANYESQAFTAGNVAKTFTENPETTTSWYSYDVYGRVQWVVQDIPGLGAKTIDYEYDPATSNVTKVYFQKHNTQELFLHRYSYNDVGELVKVETSDDDSNFTEQAAYTYYETGALKRTELADNLQGIDYIYNLNGALKSINNPVLQDDPGNDVNDVFGMAINYHHNDYQRQNTPITVPTSTTGQDQFNGNIKGITWNNNYGEEVPPVQYEYNYNRNNWLTEANFYGDSLNNIEQDIVLDTLMNNNNQTIQAANSVNLQPGFEVTATDSSRFVIELIEADSLSNGDFRVYDIAYDANGNLQSLSRNKHTENGSNEMDKLSYNYYNGGNRLEYVQDSVTAETNAPDIKNQNPGNYVYNSIGQLVYNGQDELTYSYNTAGLVTRIEKSEQTLVEFVYNDKGQRVEKKTYNQGSQVATTHYVRDVAGNVLAVYSNGQLEELNVYGNDRIGVFYKQLNTNYYEIKDHLGNVRTVIAKNGENALAIQAKTDYYPFGMAMPSRNIDGQYRYAYQGQEKDDETGMEAFELRLWDARIGRWLTVDPYGQFNSPYLGMGNNPISMVDPDGGYKNWFQAVAGWIGGGFKGNIFKSNDPATPLHKYGIDKTNSENGILVDFGNIKGDLLDAGYSWRSDGQGAIHSSGNIGNTNLFAEMDFWRSSPSQDLADFGSKILVDMTYGTVENISFSITGRTFSGNVPQGQNAFEKRFDSFLTLASGGYTQAAKTVKSVKSSGKLWNTYQKSTKGLYDHKGKHANSVKSQFYKENIKLHNSAVKNIQKSSGIFNDAGIIFGPIESASENN